MIMSKSWMLLMGAFLSTAAATTLATQALPEGIYVHDQVFPPDEHEWLNQQVERSLKQHQEDGRGWMPVSSSIYKQLQGLFGGNDDDAKHVADVAADGAILETAPVYSIPIEEHQGSYSEHKDRVHGGPMHGKVAPGCVGVFYLEGQEQRMFFRHGITGEEHGVDVKRGRLIAWDNQVYSHRLDAGGSTALRRMLGPMTYMEGISTAGGSRIASFLPVGCRSNCPCEALTGLSCVSPVFDNALTSANPTFPDFYPTDEDINISCEAHCAQFYPGGYFELTVGEGGTDYTCSCGPSTGCSQFISSPSTTFHTTDFPTQECPAAPTASPSSSPTSSPTSFPTALPSNAPVVTSAPSTAPTSVPTTTSAPSAGPTSIPTTTSTPFPTFASVPPEVPVQAVGKGYVCGPEVTLLNQTRRQLLTEGMTEEMADMGHRQLQQSGSWTPETCYRACAIRLNNPPTFVINIYYNANNQQVCTCCRRCAELTNVPSAQVFAICSGTATGLRLMAKAWPRQVKRGGLVKYSLRIRNKPELQGVGVRVELPAYTSYMKSKVKSYITGWSNAGVVVNGSVVSWPDVPMPVKQHRTFTVYVCVAQNAPVGTPLDFNGYAYQSTPVGATFCDTYAEEVRVVVKDGKVSN